MEASEAGTSCVGAVEVGSEEDSGSVLVSEEGEEASSKRSWEARERSACVSEFSLSSVVGSGFCGEESSLVFSEVGGSLSGVGLLGGILICSRSLGEVVAWVGSGSLSEEEAGEITACCDFPLFESWLS